MSSELFIISVDIVPGVSSRICENYVVLDQLQSSIRMFPSVNVGED